LENEIGGRGGAYLGHEHLPEKKSSGTTKENDSEADKEHPDGEKTLVHIPRVLKNINKEEGDRKRENQKKKRKQKKKKNKKTKTWHLFPTLRAIHAAMVCNQGDKECL
jgi:hypothetical protein